MTAPSSSSVWRLPFIKSSALPSRTSSTARAAEAWLWGTSTLSVLPRSIFLALVSARIFSAGPTRIGTIRPNSAASSAPSSAVISQGCATAVGIGASFLQRSSNWSNFVIDHYLLSSRFRDTRTAHGGRTRFLEQQREHEREYHAVQQRLKRRLVMPELALRRVAGDGHEKPSEHGAEQRAEREVDEVHDTRCGAAMLGRVRFLDHGVGQHRRARGDARE